MKRRLIFIIMLIAILCCAMSAAGEKTINPETDAVFTCGSNPEDFNGKTFENLYVLLKGCTDLRSTIIPEDNVFVTLRDITVNGTVYYVDDKYDAATNTYIEAEIKENETKADHWLNIAGDSVIQNIEMNCIDPHTCNLGLKFPAYIENLYIYPTNPLNRGKIALHGIIEWFVDKDTDYYNDKSLAFDPDFDLNTIANEMGNTIVNYYHELFALNKLYTLLHAEKSPLGELELFRLMSDIAPQMFTSSSAAEDTNATLNIDNNILAFYIRGYVNNVFISNLYKQNIGNTYIDFNNVRCNQVYVSNNSVLGGEYTDTYNLNWKPVIEASGYSNIGTLSVYSDLSVTTLDTPPYKAGAEDEAYETAPFHIDAMIVGTEGRTVNIDLDRTKIYMFNYLGGLSKDSILNLTTKDQQIRRRVNQTGIGILTVNGGRLNYMSEKMHSENPTVFEFYILPGREDLRYKPVNETEIVDATSVLSIDYFSKATNTNISNTYELQETLGKTRYDEILAKVDSPCNDSLKKNTLFIVSPGTVQGSNWINNYVLNYLTPISSDTELNRETHVNIENASMGNMYYSIEIQDNFMSGSCNFLQWGTSSGQIVPFAK